MGTDFLGGFEQYKKEIMSLGPLLTAEQEIALANKIQTGDTIARDKLVETNLRLVVYIAKKFVSRTSFLSIEDLIQEGSLGLLEAAKRFDPKYNCRFSTYAYFWITRSMHRAIFNSKNAIHVPEHLAVKISKALVLSGDLAVQLDRSPNREEIARAAGLGGKDIVWLLDRLEAINLIRSLDYDLDDDCPRVETISDPDAVLPEEHVGIEILDKLDEILPAREAEIIRKRYLDLRTFADIGEDYGVCRERVSQLEKSALGKLREFYSAA